MSRRGIDPSAAAAVLRLLADGKISCAEIVRRTGVSRPTVFRMKAQLKQTADSSN
jgi:DNA-binding IclR family transcriptional regulator